MPKFLLNNKEAFVEVPSILTPEVIAVHWIVNGVYKVISAGAVTGEPGQAGATYTLSRRIYEILDLNGFDYNVSVPDYSLIIKNELTFSTEGRILTDTEIISLRDQIRLQSALSEEYLYVLDDMVSRAEPDFGQNAKNFLLIDDTVYPIIVDAAPYNVYKPVEIQTPIGFDITTVPDTSGPPPATGNGQINVINAWGTAPPMQVSLNGGSFLSQLSFTNLPWGTYTVQVRDGNLITAEPIQVTVENQTTL